MRRFGVILIEESEIIFRIYETTDHEWKLFHYHSSLLPARSTRKLTKILALIGNFFSSDYAQHIAEWKICSRKYSRKFIKNLEQAISLDVENISLHREQELICKGLFTELW